jgi:hypothetical protein
MPTRPGHAIAKAKGMHKMGNRNHTAFRCQAQTFGQADLNTSDLIVQHKINQHKIAARNSWAWPQSKNTKHSQCDILLVMECDRVSDGVKMREATAA